jgi:hypothetical protein
MGKGVEYSLGVCRLPVLAELKLAFDSGDRNLEDDDTLDELVPEVIRKGSGPGLLEG